VGPSIPVLALGAQLAAAQAAAPDAWAHELAGLRLQVAALEATLHGRLQEVETALQQLRDGMAGAADAVEPVAAAFLASPPPPSDLVGVADAPVFSPRLAVDSPARHDIVFLEVRRVEPRGATLVGETELSEAIAAAVLPLDRNGALYVVDWETSEGHDYQLVLRDGLSGRSAATVEVSPYEHTGRFIFVGYGVGLEPLRRRRP